MRNLSKYVTAFGGIPLSLYMVQRALSTSSRKPSPELNPADHSKVSFQYSSPKTHLDEPYPLLRVPRG